MKRTPIRKITWRETIPDPVTRLMRGRSYLADTGVRAIVTNHPTEGLHISVSAAGRYPTWDELASIRDKAARPDQRLVMWFPPHDEYVNLHNTTLHITEVDAPTTNEPKAVAP